MDRVSTDPARERPLSASDNLPAINGPQSRFHSPHRLQRQQRYAPDHFPADAGEPVGALGRGRTQLDHLDLLSGSTAW